MTGVVSSLVCFAVKEEAGYFRQLAGRRPGLQILLTGMGRHNAEKAIGKAFAEGLPHRVITAGFAGGLVPDLANGTVVFSADKELGLEPALLAAGARPVRFHCSERVLTTAEQKRAVHEKTGAEAVEMESAYIQSLCRARQVPVATVRVILDTASEDLALDFNQLLTADQRIDPLKLALTLLKSPSKISALLRLQKQSAAAARRLGDVLDRVLPL
jgi:adenosylhomocysteine nucleosidase